MCVPAFKLVSLLGFDRVCRVFAGARVCAIVLVLGSSVSPGASVWPRSRTGLRVCARSGKVPVRAGMAVGAAGVRSGRDHNEACRVEVRTGSCGGVCGSERRETESVGMVHLGVPDLPWWIVWAQTSLGYKGPCKSCVLG
jgi:hypothetical protein